MELKYIDLGNHKARDPAGNEYVVNVTRQIVVSTTKRGKTTTRYGQFSASIVGTGEPLKYLGPGSYAKLRDNTPLAAVSPEAP